MASNDTIFMRVPRELKEAAQKAAQADGRDLTGWIKKLMRDALAKGDRKR